MSALLPGATLGILGGGQLGRMTAVPARRMGYRVVVFEPGANCPAGQVADEHIAAPFEDRAALARFARSVDAVTLEFENLPAAVVDTLAETLPVRPSAMVLRVCQNRLAERRFLQQHGIDVAPFAAVHDRADLPAAAAHVAFPALLKTATLGYDSKGQRRVAHPEHLADAFSSLGGVSCLLEQHIDFEREISVIVARDCAGTVLTYDPAENVHRQGILDLSSTPVNLSDAVTQAARDLATRIALALDLVGVLAVEFFLTVDQRLLVNEMAPRPHNSGHWSIEASITSQFEQQARIALGLPAGPTTLLAPAATANLLGDLWQHGEPRWERLLAMPDVKLHLYGKAEARPGRKMGHVTALGATAEAARRRVIEARTALQVAAPRR